MNIRFVIRTFLLFQRVEVFLAVLLPFFLILESAIANAWAYAGGSFDFHDGRTYVALGRGLFFEVLTYSCAKLVKVLCRVKTQSSIASAVVVGFLALVAILVSAGITWRGLRLVMNSAVCLGRLLRCCRLFLSRCTGTG